MGIDRRWSQAGSLTTFNSSIGLIMQKSFDTPSVFTAQFAIGGDSSRVSGGNTTARRCFAQIEWSCGGNSVRRVVSVYNGSSISGVASGVTIKVFDRSSALAGTPIRYDYPVSVQLAPGTRPSQQQPPMLDLIGRSLVIPSGTDQTFNLETICRTLFGFSDVGIISANVLAFTDESNQPGVSAPDVFLDQLTTGGTALATYNPLRTPGWQPMFPGVAQVAIGAGAAIVGSVIASIVFGIDG